MRNFIFYCLILENNGARVFLKQKKEDREQVYIFLNFKNYNNAYLS